MNIFYLNRDPIKAAQVQYNKHVVKMILESAQMLCTAHHHYTELLAQDDSYIPYKKAHYNHPSTIWCRENSEQYLWLYDHMIALGDEYTKRYKKIHLTIKKCADILQATPAGIPLGTFEEPPQCMPDQYKVAGCSVTAYWNYYEQEKHTVAAKDEQLIFRDYDKKTNLQSHY
jgi:hypothetical protein